MRFHREGDGGKRPILNAAERIEKYRRRLERVIQRICRVAELAVAVLVLLGIILALVGLLRNTAVFGDLLGDASALKQYLDYIFIIVIGIEFLQMLCRPTSDNVVEVLIFLVARHMIVGNTTTYEDFVSVVSVSILCVLRKYLHTGRKGGEAR